MTFIVYVINVFLVFETPCKLKIVKSALPRESLTSVKRKVLLSVKVLVCYRELCLVRAVAVTIENLSKLQSGFFLSLLLQRYSVK